MASRIPRGEDDQQWNASTPPKDEERTPVAKEEDRGKDPYLVDWDGEKDKANPLNWSTGRKIWITFQLGMLALAGSLGSSIISPANETIAEYVGVSNEVGILSVSLYM